MSLMISSWTSSLSLPLLVGNPLVQAADKRKRMTSPGGVALGCDPRASGSLVAHPRAFEQSMTLPARPKPVS